jgi:hypothetical protein
MSKIFRLAIQRLSVAALAWRLLSPLAAAAPITTFDDIVYWTGTGSNRAAIVIDFDGESTTDQALTWGFRWDGEANGRDMLVAVVTADPRLYLKLNTLAAVESEFYGIGYDRNDNGEFDVEGEFSAPSFDDAGFAFGVHDDSAAPTDVGDWYREGWEDNFWRWGYSRDNPWTGGRWQTPERFGPSRWPLVDGQWDSWALAPVIKDNPGEYPELYAANPVIATPPGGHADFDGDGVVTASDFLTWQRGLGLPSPTPSDGDANGDGAVDGRDLDAWRTQFGSTGGSVRASSLAVPEPNLLTTCASALFVVLRFVRHQSWRAS